MYGLGGGPQQLQPSLGPVTLGCRDTSLPMLLPVLDLALPAGRGAGEHAGLVEVRKWSLGVHGPRIPSPAAIPFILAPRAAFGGLRTAEGTAGPLWSHCLEDVQPVGLRPSRKEVRRAGLGLAGGDTRAALPVSMPSTSLLPTQPASPSCLQPQVLLRGAEYVPQLVLGDGLPLASVLSL